jgi:hypothetical protein
VQAAVIVALIGSVTSVVVTSANLYWTAHQKKQERRQTARVQLDEYREPLLIAVDELDNRVDSIRNRRFLSYLRTERGDLACKSTLFRLARYLGWIEILYGQSGQLRFASDERTKGVAETIAWIASTLAEDRYDLQTHDGGIKSRLVLWREEQRAIGELMLCGPVERSCIGYSEFIASFDQRMEPWSKSFAADLTEPSNDGFGSPDSERLRQLRSVRRSADGDRSRREEDVVTRAEPELAWAAGCPSNSLTSSAVVSCTTPSERTRRHRPIASAAVIRR